MINIATGFFSHFCNKVYKPVYFDLFKLNLVLWIIHHIQYNSKFNNNSSCFRDQLNNIRCVRQADYNFWKPTAGTHTEYWQIEKNIDIILYSIAQKILSLHVSILFVCLFAYVCAC